MVFHSVHPFSGEIINNFQQFKDSEIEKTLQLSDDAYGTWNRQYDVSARSKLLISLSKVLLGEKEVLGELITMEMGKVISESIAEIEKCAGLCQYYAENAENFLAPTAISPPHGKAYISYRPIGTVLGIMPWNFPFWQVFRFAIPTILLGNVAILKHAPNVFGCAEAIVGCFAKAGFPLGVFQSLITDNDQVAKIISDRRVHAVTLTGSERAGKEVASQAGRYLKKTVLELGGSDPFIVLADADLKKAAEMAVKSRMINAGQSCIAAKRFFIHEEVFDAFLKEFLHQLERYTLGNPLDKNMNYGPMARLDLAGQLQKQVEKTISMGASVLKEGGMVRDNSSLFESVVLTDIPIGSPAYNEELFGPVASLFAVKSMDEAIDIANSSLYGLGASIWTSDVPYAENIASRLSNGCVYINQMMFSHPAIPFGGVKLSGYGRELSLVGLREFANQQTVWIS